MRFSVDARPEDVEEYGAKGTAMGKRVHSDYKKANKKLKWHKVRLIKEHWVRELAEGIKRHDRKQITNASIRLTEVDKLLLIIIERKITRGR